MTKGLKVWSDWQLQLCRLKSTNDYRGKYLFYCLLPEEKKKRERRELVTLFLTVRSPKGETATRMWMERTRLVPTGWGECSESAVCRHRDSVNRTPLSCSTWLPHQLLHLLSSFPSISCSFISKDTRKKEIKIWHVPSRYKSICWTKLVDLKTWGVQIHQGHFNSLNGHLPFTLSFTWGSELHYWSRSHNPCPFGEHTAIRHYPVDFRSSNLIFSVFD